MEHRASRAHAASTSRSMEPLPDEDQLGGVEYGEGDEVTKFTSNDMESLQPGNLLSGNVVDFYIKHLLEGKDHLYFFDSEFFVSAIQGDATTRWQECNIFEKEYVFIPVHQSSHWSLIIICHLTSLASSADNHKCPPCIVHMDSGEGKHGKLEDDIRRYIINAWKERFPNPDIKQSLMLSKMTYSEAKVPQQENEYDSGIHLLLFVDLFLLLLNQDVDLFLLLLNQDKFAAAWDASEVPAMRGIINDLIKERTLASERKSKERQRQRSRLNRLNPYFEEQDEARLNVSERRTEDQHNNDLMELDSGVGAEPNVMELDSGVEHVDQQTIGEIELDNQPQLASEPVKSNKRGKNWSKAETDTLLKCKQEGAPRFCEPGRTNVTKWSAISKEIRKSVHSKNPPSGNQCRNRFDTLLKAYKTAKEHCEKTGKQFSALCPGEVKLTTKLLPEWYNALDEINRSPSKAGSSKHSHGPVDVGSDSMEELQQPSMSGSEGLYMLRNLGGGGGGGGGGVGCHGMCKLPCRGRCWSKYT